MYSKTIQQRRQLLIGFMPDNFMCTCSEKRIFWSKTANQTHVVHSFLVSWLVEVIKNISRPLPDLSDYEKKEEKREREKLKQMTRFKLPAASTFFFCSRVQEREQQKGKESPRHFSLSLCLTS